MRKALVVGIGLLVLPGLLLVGSLSAGPPKKSSDLSQSSANTKKDGAKTTGKRDFVEEWLALPKSHPLDSLRKDQQDAYEKLKDEYKPKLQDALDRKDDKAAKQQDKDKAARDLGKLKKEFGAKLQAILKQPDPTKKVPTAANRPSGPKPHHTQHKH